MAKKKETSKETSNDIVKDIPEEIIDNTAEEEIDYTADYTAYKPKDEITETAPAKERLNKFIAANGIFSRRKIDEFIVEGRVSVNGKEVFDLGTKINPQTDKVFIDGERVRITDKKIYLMMNKPINVITSVSDDKKRPTVIDILNTKTKIFPVGRLDFHTTGLLILTNDGDFANKLMNPVYKIYKTYEAKLSRPLDQKHRMLLEKGIKLEGVYTLPAIINLPNERDYTDVEISISQGKNRQVRRMFEHFGYFVNKLHRSGYGGLKLGNLREGEFRKMTKEEVDTLMKKQPAPKTISEDKFPRERAEKNEVKGVKKNYTRGPKDFKKDKPGRDFKKKFVKDNDEPRKDFTKKITEERPSRFSKDTDSKRGFKKKFSDEKPRENKIDYKKKFSNDTRADKRPKKGYEDDFSDRPKSSVRDDDFVRKDSKPGFKKKFSKDGPKKFSKDGPRTFSKDAPKSFSKEEPKKFSKDSKSRDSKPAYKKKFSGKVSSGTKNFKSGFKKKFK